MNKLKSTEKATQAAVIHYLTLRRIFHYRQNSGAYKSETGTFLRYGTKGSTDILAVVNGLYVGMEIKDTKGVLNENQKEFQANLEAAGGMYCVVRSLDDAVKCIDAAVKQRGGAN